MRGSSLALVCVAWVWFLRVCFSPLPSFGLLCSAPPSWCRCYYCVSTHHHTPCLASLFLLCHRCCVWFFFQLGSCPPPSVFTATFWVFMQFPLHRAVMVMSVAISSAWLLSLLSDGFAFTLASFQSGRSGSWFVVSWLLSCSMQGCVNGAPRFSGNFFTFGSVGLAPFSKWWLARFWGEKGLWVAAVPALG